MRSFSSSPRRTSPFAIYGTALMLCGCAAEGPLQPLAADPKVPAQWMAPRPDAERVSELKTWWRSHNEPELATLIDAADAVSPNIASALARIERARAAQTQAWSMFFPEVSATASFNRSHAPLYRGTYVQKQAGLKVSWAVDVAGLRGAYTSAARADLESAQASWHDARTLVAAEVADLYYASRTCRRQSALYAQDVASYALSVQMVQRSVQAGMASDAELAEARYNAAEGAGLLQQQQALCEIQIKGLVALTGTGEADLRQLLQTAWERKETPVSFAIAAVPAQALAQRPDIYVAEREVLQAQARVMQAQADRLPRLTLEGFVGHGNFDFGGVKTTNASSWNIGPIALTLPIFDAGRRVAEQRAAEEELKAAISAYHARVRLAVREVEEALVQLDSADQRLRQSRVAAEQAGIRLQASERLQQQGMLSSLEVEELRRKVRISQFNTLALDLESRRAWTTLYRAVGGGFESASPSAGTSP